MTRAVCGNGHIYDSDQYSVCPYCNGVGNMISFDGSDSPGRTVGPGGTAQGHNVVGRTAAPSAGDHGSEIPGKTVAPADYVKEQQELGHTMGVLKKKFDFDPVVGWLVCVRGAARGRSFQLYAKVNTIGRSKDNDVCISGDETISREHARLAYDPKSNSFRIIPGQLTNNMYINDEAVYTPFKLSAYDTIEMGETVLLFVPFCGDRFRWEDTEKQD